MNGKMVAFWERAAEAALIASAFLLPLAFHLNTFDAGVVKELTLQTAGVLIVGCTLLRHIESGRFEMPANRLRVALLGAAGLGAAALPLLQAAHPQTVFFDAARAAACAALFIVVLTGPASIAFAAALIDATLAAAAIAGLYAACQLGGVDPLPWRGAFGTQAFSTLTDPALLGVFLGAVFPLGLARGADPAASAWGRLAARGAALLAVIGVLASGSTAGLFTLWIAAALYGLTALMALRAAEIRADGAAALAVLPVTAWASFDEASALGGTWDVARASFEPLMLMVGAALIGTALLLSARDLRRRAGEGEEREPLLIAGLWSASAALAFSAVFSEALTRAVPGAFLWLFAGLLAGLALERGAARVCVLPIPAPAAARRLLYVPVLALIAAGLFWQNRFFRSDLSHNAGIFHAQAGDWERAGAAFDAVSGWHARGLDARYMAARASEERGRLEDALARYRAVDQAAPRYARTDFRMGRLHAKLGEWDQAEERYQIAAKLSGDIEAYYGLAEVSTILGRPDQAQRAALMIVSLEPDQPRHWHHLSQRYKEAGKKRIARRMLERAAKVHELAEARKTRNARPL